MPFTKPARSFEDIPSAQTLRNLRPPSRLRTLLEPMAWDKTKIMDEQWDKALDTTRWTVANSGGTGVSNFAVPSTKIVGNVAQGATGTTSSGSQSMIGPLAYKASQNAGMLVIFSIDVITSVNFEFGFIDAAPGSNNPGVSDVDTPAVNMTNGALMTIDTSQTITTLAAVTSGNGASQTVKAQTFAGITTPTVNKYYALLLQLSGATDAATDAYFEIRQLGSSQNSAAGGYLAVSSQLRNFDRTNGCVASGTLLAPWVYAKTLNTTTKKINIQRWVAWQDVVV